MITTSLYKESSIHSFAKSTLFKYRSINVKRTTETKQNTTANERYDPVTKTVFISSSKVVSFDLATAELIVK